jgi:hypothetical protein
VAALVSRHPRAEAYAAFTVLGRSVLRTPVVTGARVVRIDGRERVRSVEVEQIRTGRRRTIECDTVITSGDWVPDHELARLGGVDLDAGTRGPVVDAALATSVPGVFAVGNLVHPVDTADGAALDGRHVAGAVTRWLTGGLGNEGPGALLEGMAGGHRPGMLHVTASPPFRWVTPQHVPVGGGVPRGQLLLWVDDFHRLPVVLAQQGGVEVGRVRVPWPAAPGRIFRVPERVLRGAHPARGPVTLHLA